MVGMVAGEGTGALGYNDGMIRIESSRWLMIRCKGLGFEMRYESIALRVSIGIRIYNSFCSIWSVLLANCAHTDHSPLA